MAAQVFPALPTSLNFTTPEVCKIETEQLTKIKRTILNLFASKFCVIHQSTPPLAHPQW